MIGKFRKERDVPMQPDASAALKEQLEEEDKLWKQNPQRRREVLAEVAVRAKISTIIPHGLRHMFGTRWLQADLAISTSGSAGRVDISPRPKPFGFWPKTSAGIWTRCWTQFSAR